MTSEPELLFVYGTLMARSQHPMARYLAERAACVGEAKIAGRLYNLGRFPGLIEPEAPDDWVVGDLYDLGKDAAGILNALDRYEDDESAPGAIFQRKQSEVVIEDGSVRAAWVWWFLGAVRPEQRIMSGRYLEADRS